ncbi:MAG: prephenate dehydratase domain-containing protein [Eubacteriales bacterium]|nr:prephenate dehydratase domain-containing protein [Eubacteriales bacterium]
MENQSDKNVNEQTDKLAVARKTISEVDSEMRRLFIKRMEAVHSVYEYKKEHALPILDEAREEYLIRHNSERVEDDEIRGYYTEFLRNNMRISRSYQSRLMNGAKVAFSGVEGAFAYIAADKIFPDAKKIPFPDFRTAYDAVVNGECDFAVLPIENSTAGEVGAVFDMLFSGSLYITGVYDLYITHHLMAKPGCKLSDIRDVISHPQALSQCASYIREHGFSIQEFENTARAAKFVSQSERSDVAAIASEETAKLYGLDIIARNINENNTNTTRFATLAKAKVSSSDERDRHSIMMFTVSNEAGSLAHAVNIIGKYGYNMRCLRSRPMKELLWQYYFYVEAEGNFDTENGRKMLAELSSSCDKLKVLGSFRYPAEIH